MAFLLGEVSPERPGYDLRAGHRPAFPAQPGKGRSRGSSQSSKVQQELPASTRIATQ